jgi:hypothetical protein
MLRLIRSPCLSLDVNCNPLSKHTQLIVRTLNSNLCKIQLPIRTLNSNLRKIQLSSNIPQRNYCASRWISVYISYLPPIKNYSEWHELILNNFRALSPTSTLPKGGQVYNIMCLFVICLSRGMFYQRTALHIVTAEECFVTTGLLAVELKA